jgi:hypothetical protein
LKNSLIENEPSSPPTLHGQVVRCFNGGVLLSDSALLQMPISIVPIRYNVQWDVLGVEFRLRLFFRLSSSFVAVSFSLFLFPQYFRHE